MEKTNDRGVLLEPVGDASSNPFPSPNDVERVTTAPTPKTLRFKAMRIRGAYKGRYMIDVASLLDATADAWQDDIIRRHTADAKALTLELQLAVSEKARQRAEEVVDLARATVEAKLLFDESGEPEAWEDTWDALRAALAQKAL